MRLGLSLVLLLAWNGIAAAAEDPQEQQIREELERELARETEGMMKSSPPPALEIFFDPTIDPKYELQEATFALDGNTLPYQLPTSGRQSLYFGILAPGQHVVTVALVYREKPTSAFFNYTTLKYRLPGRYVFGAQRGLHMRMQMKVEANNAVDAAKRLSLQASLEADMMVDASDQLRADKRPAVVEVEGSAPDAGTAGGKTAQATTVPAVTPATDAAHVAASGGATAPASGGKTGAVAVQATSPATGATGPVAVQAGTPATGGTAAGVAQVQPGPSPDAASPAAAPPKRKRIRRHMKNLLQNLAKSAKDDDGAQDVRLKSLQKNLFKSLKQEAGGEWQEVRDEVVEESDPAPTRTVRPAADTAPAPANPEKAVAGDAGSKSKRGSSGKAGAGSKKKSSGKSGKGSK